MTGEPGVDYPEEKVVVEVKATSREDVLTSFVERAAPQELVLTVGMDAAQRRVRLEPGEQLQLLWKGPEELRALPAELVHVEAGEGPTWRVRPVGPASRGQRRAAVRAPVSVPVELGAGDQVLLGASVDLSEGGMRCLLSSPVPAASPSLEPGSVVPVALVVGGDRMTCNGEVVRRHARTDDRAELSFRFLRLGERQEDVIRREVFAQLRELRSRGLL
ncbi:flagellar brake protein [Blastococcus sp. SYSU DS0533]